MEKFTIYFMMYLMAMAVAVPTVYSMDTPIDPQSVQNWFEKLANSKEKLTKLHFFFHDIATGKNETAFDVARLNTSLQSPTFFGIVRVVDDALRAGSQPESKIIGRAEGIYGAASLEESAFLMTLNLVFTDGDYNGSTLSLFGYNPITHKYREIAIVGGSGVFRLARGIATVRTIWFNLTSLYFVMEYHVMVLHY
ncbi:dirigent protein 22-like [Primulina huaijiensis]|uniref:dirigent protein 22-like n=1 Tax=Primulina huaijiensis TaxID=1492673 RepID=UPI003CC717EB